MAKKAPHASSPPRRTRGIFSALLVLIALCCGICFLAVAIVPTSSTPTISKASETASTPQSVAQQSSYTLTPALSSTDSMRQISTRTTDSTVTSEAANSLVSTNAFLTPSMRDSTIMPSDPEAFIKDALTKRLPVESLVFLEIDDTRHKGGQRVLKIGYTTTETTQQGYNNDWINILTILGATIKNYKLDLDNILLIYGPSEDQATGVFTVGIKDLLAHSTNQITRTELLRRAGSSRFNTLTSVSPTRPPTSVPRPTPTSPSNQRVCPSNCTEARARGFTAREAAACGLDGDGDGVACYGD